MPVLLYLHSFICKCNPYKGKLFLLTLLLLNHIIILIMIYVQSDFLQKMQR